MLLQVIIPSKDSSLLTEYLGDACLRGMEATGFAKAMLDKALGFLLKQCKTYT